MYGSSWYTSISQRSDAFEFMTSKAITNVRRFTIGWLTYTSSIDCAAIVHVKVPPAMTTTLFCCESAMDLQTDVVGMLNRGFDNFIKSLPAASTVDCRMLNNTPKVSSTKVVRSFIRFKATNIPPQPQVE